MAGYALYFSVPQVILNQVYNEFRIKCCNNLVTAELMKAHVKLGPFFFFNIFFLGYIQTNPKKK